LEKKYEWDRKRFETERNQEIFSEELLEFARKLMQKISKDMDNKTPTPQSEIYSLMNILKNIPQVKQYESSNQKSKQQKQTSQLTPEIIEQIERKVLGI
jgi:non-homologous end joining protein Ku